MECVPHPYYSHQGPELKVEIELSEEQFHRRAKKNVERWVSAHIVPVRTLLFLYSDTSTLTSWMPPVGIPTVFGLFSAQNPSEEEIYLIHAYREE